MDDIVSWTLVLGRQPGARIGWTSNWPSRALVTDLETAQLWRVGR